MPEPRQQNQAAPALPRWPGVLLSLVIWHASSALAADSRWVEKLAFWSWGALEALDTRIRDHEQRLSGLPEPALINSCMRVGLKTGYTTEEDVRWMEVTLSETARVDTVVLVPPLAKAANAVVAGYGFPLRFKVEVFDDHDAAHVVLDHTAADFANPGCWPVIARFDPRAVKRVRFTATEPWSVDGPEILALAELLVLSGARNLAIDATVSSSSSRNAPRAWTRSNLIDMVTPLGLPLVPQAGGKSGFHSAPSTRKDERKSLTLTLPEITPVDEIRLVPVRRRDVPLWFDYGFPELYTVEAATREDFSDAVTLVDVTDEFLPSPGMNFVCIPARRTPAKFIRITTKELWYRKNDHVFALAEMQVLHDGENIAPRGRFTASDVLTGADAANWGLEALNDGLTEAGRLISLPEWFAQIETRRSLEQERLDLRTRRAALVERSQHQLVYGSVGSVGGITLISGLLLWRQHRQRRRETQRLHDKLARDLHDEIGSNLGSITLICSMAAQPDATLDSLKADIIEIESVAAETADSMRDMVDLISTRRSEAEHDWLDVLHRLTERLLRGVTLDCALPAAPLTLEPDIETRRELYLFCKEVLHNIARHAQASKARFHLTPTPRGIRIEISDNGAGFDTAAPSSGHGLGNLRERAAVLKAVLQIHSTPGAGTSITLDVPCGPRWRKPEA
jgi:signal transduction histidine kinase